MEIGGKFYARWTVEGVRVYGEARDTYAQADDDRVKKRPSPSAKPAPIKRTIPSLQQWAFDNMRPGSAYGDHLADSTHATNEDVRTVHIEGNALGKKRLDKINRDDVLHWAKSLKKKVVTLSEKGEPIVTWEPCSPSWRLRCLAFVSRLMTLAIEAGIRLDNPCKGLTRYLPKVEERENRTLAPEEAVRLLNPTTRTDEIMLVAMHTGMRRGEVIRLEWRHVGTDSLKVPGTKSRHAKRTVPLTQEVRSIVERQPRRSQYVFTTESGLPLNPRNLTRDVAARKAALGIPKETRLHDLRGSYASLLIEAGVDPRAVMELLGHGDPRTTMKMYARSRQEVKQQGVQKLRRLIQEAAEPGEQTA